VSNATSSRLTPREGTVFRELVLGKTNSEIADQLFVSQDTAREYIARLYNKMGVRRRSALIAKALELGLLEIVVKV
jgi:DNA-binding CsgD family transcriptional regulator